MDKILEKISKLRVIWNHIPKAKLKSLKHLIKQSDILNCLYDLFSEKAEEVYLPRKPWYFDKDEIMNDEYFCIQLHDGKKHILIVKVCSTLELQGTIIIKENGHSLNLRGGLKNA